MISTTVLVRQNQRSLLLQRKQGPFSIAIDGRGNRPRMGFLPDVRLTTRTLQHHEIEKNANNPMNVEIGRGWASFLLFIRIHGRVENGT